MHWFIGVFIIAPIWGMLSAQLLIQSWVFFISAIINLIGITIRNCDRKANATKFVIGIVSAVMF